MLSFARLSFVGGTMRRGIGWVLYTFLAGAAPAALPASAETTPPSATEIAASEQQFAADVAKAGNIDAGEILATLKKAHYQQSVIDTISRPAESKPWKEYRPIFVNDRRVDDGVAFYKANRALLERIAAEYRVPAEVIVAIIGVESNYGHTPMRYKVLDALTTLAFYYPPRQDFFRDELKRLFLLRSPAFPYALEDLNGSYAGAMGWGQFMPSSIANFARDGDGDGKIDLWNSLPDICASIANYFAAHGWQKDGPVAQPAHVDAQARAIEPNGLTPVYSLQQLGEWGYTIDAKLASPCRTVASEGRLRAAGAQEPECTCEYMRNPSTAGAQDAERSRLCKSSLDPMTPATLIKLDGADGPEFWMTFQNFYVISRYNRSPLYSLAVHQVSRAIAAEVAASQ